MRTKAPRRVERTRITYLEAAAILGITKQRVQQLVEKGALPRAPLLDSPPPQRGRRVWLDLADVMALKARREGREP